MVELVGVRNCLVIDLHENVLQHSFAWPSVQSFEGSGSSLNVAEQVGDGLVVRVHDPPHVVVVLAVVVVHQFTHGLAYLGMVFAHPLKKYEVVGQLTKN